MAGYGYIGQAGTGKTTQLINRVVTSIDFDTWPATSSILAITFMHGSRKRLENKLRHIQLRGVKVCCQTIDAFSLNIVQRYKSYLNINGSVIVSDDPDEFSEIDGRLYLGINRVRDRANELLDFAIIQEILSYSYPIVIVDEFQDCDGVLLEIIQKLSGCGHLYVAADDFQKLDDSPDCPAIVWLQRGLEFTNLEHIWRTNNESILNSSSAIRTNNPTSRGIQLEYVPSKDLAAYIILSNMQWYDRMGSNGRTIAIISPVGPHSDSFVQQTLQRLNSPIERKTSRKKKGYRLEAKPFQIEGEQRITSLEILNQLVGWDSIEVVTREIIDTWSYDRHIGFDICIKRAIRLMKLRNIRQLSKNEFSGLLSSSLHFANTYLSSRKDTRIFLTVHGAKNREFDDVFILWPQYTLPSQDLYLRKLMYNAITRAQRKVIIIVQGSEARHSECPLNLL